MALVEYFWNHWMLVAFLAPLLWALVNIIDVYFVSSVYADEWDGIFIGSLVQILPWSLPLFGLVTFHFPGIGTSTLALLGGCLLTLAFFCYFKTLFHSNDVVVAVALWNVSIPLVPFLAWLLIDEHLMWRHYLGIGLAFVGALLLVVHKKIQAKSIRQVLWLMLGAVLLLSLSMVIQRQVYSVLEGDFWTGLLLFSLGSALSGLLLLFFYPWSVRVRLRHLARLSRRYFWVFLMAELLNLFAVVAQQRAIDISPAVSFVVVIESASPVFVMFLSLLLMLVFAFFDKEKALEIYRNQLVAFKTKVVACCIIAGGIYLIS